jgi:hypothetical protein
VAANKRLNIFGKIYSLICGKFYYKKAKKAATGTSLYVPVAASLLPDLGCIVQKAKKRR